jgi:hypothetical protein
MTLQVADWQPNIALQLTSGMACLFTCARDIIWKSRSQLNAGVTGRQLRPQGDKTSGPKG